MIVVDTNILAYLYLDCQHTEDVHRLGRLDPEWMAPVLWRSELRNVLTGYLRRGQLTTYHAALIMQQAAGALVAGEHQVENEAVFTLVTESRCSAYDCEFVALALAQRCHLVTEDKRVIAAFPQTCFSLQQMIQG